MGSHRSIFCGFDVHDLRGVEIHEEAEEMTPFVFMALPALVGSGLVLAGSRGMGTEDTTQANILETQLRQMQAISGSLVAIGLIAVPILSVVSILWILRRNR